MFREAIFPFFMYEILEKVLKFVLVEGKENTLGRFLGRRQDLNFYPDAL